MNNIIELIKTSPFSHKRVLQSHRLVSLEDSVGLLVEGLVSKCFVLNKNSHITTGIIRGCSLLNPISGGRYQVEKTSYVISLHKRHLPSIDWNEMTKVDNDSLLDSLEMLALPGDARVLRALNKLSQAQEIGHNVKGGIDFGPFGKGEIGTVTLISRLTMLQPESVGRILRKLRA
jgi:hypothetical protein